VPFLIVLSSDGLNTSILFLDENEMMSGVCEYIFTPSGLYTKRLRTSGESQLVPPEIPQKSKWHLTFVS
ncbi:MAG: hypothetical protein WBD56_16340, partial [Anaerolineales bacterium]